MSKNKAKKGHLKEMSQYTGGRLIGTEDHKDLKQQDALPFYLFMVQIY